MQNERVKCTNGDKASRYFYNIYTGALAAASHVGEQLPLVHTVLAGSRAVGSPKVGFPKVVDAVVHVLVYLHVLRLADHGGAPAARVGV